MLFQSVNPSTCIISKCRTDLKIRKTRASRRMRKKEEEGKKWPNLRSKHRFEVEAERERERQYSKKNTLKYIEIVMQISTYRNAKHKINQNHNITTPRNKKNIQPPQLTTSSSKNSEGELVGKIQRNSLCIILSFGYHFKLYPRLLHSFHQIRTKFTPPKPTVTWHLKMQPCKTHYWKCIMFRLHC